jgi:hypothetical protein
MFELLPLDITWTVVDSSEPRDTVALALTSPKFHSLLSARTRGLRFAREALLLKLLHTRTKIRCRLMVLASICELPSGHLSLHRERCLERLLTALQRSPEPLADLAASVHKALAAVSSQSLVEPTSLSRLGQDLSTLSTAVCLLAWRERRQRQVTTAAPGEGVASATSSAVVSAAAARQQTVGVISGALHRLVLSSNPSTKLCEATVYLLAQFVEKELESWPPQLLVQGPGEGQQEQQEEGAQAGQQEQQEEQVQVQVQALQAAETADG